MGAGDLHQGSKGFWGGGERCPPPAPRVRSLSSAVSWHLARTPGVGDSSLPRAGPWLKPPGLGGRLHFPHYTGDTNGQTPSVWQAQSLEEAEGKRRRKQIGRPQAGRASDPLPPGPLPVPGPEGTRICDCSVQFPAPQGAEPKFEADSQES